MSKAVEQIFHKQSASDLINTFSNDQKAFQPAKRCF